jgi:hypothetical protein
MYYTNSRQDYGRLNFKSTDSKGETMDKITIKTKDITGCEYLVVPATGQEAYEKVAAALRDGKCVELDFEGIRVITSTPMNYAIGQLFNGEFSEEFLKEHLSFTGMNGWDKYLIDAVIENAKRYYSVNGSIHQEEALKKFLYENKEESKTMKELLETAIRMHAELEELHSQLPWVDWDVYEINDLKRKANELEIGQAVKERATK